MIYNVLKYSIVDDEIIRSILYYESVSYDLGLRFETEIEKALDKFRKKPYILFHTQG